MEPSLLVDGSDRADYLADSGGSHGPLADNT